MKETYIQGKLKKMIEGRGPKFTKRCLYEVLLAVK